MATDTQQCLAAYGDPTTNAFQQKWLVKHPLPAQVLPYFPRYGGTTVVTHIYMNRFATAALDAVLLELLSTGLIKELKSYHGCWNVRPKRTVAEMSTHAWGLAQDFNEPQNPLGVVWGSRKGMFSKAFLDVWRKHGWKCGADFKDAMHFQYTSRFPEDVTKLLKLDQVKDARLRSFLRDIAEAHGARDTAKRLQALLNGLGAKPKLVEDGLVGPATIAAVNAEDASDILLAF